MLVGEIKELHLMHQCTVGLFYDTLWLWTIRLVLLLVGLACFLQSGRYDWFPDRACRRSCVDPLSSQTAHVQVQVMDGLCECDHEAISCIPAVFLWLYTDYLLGTFTRFATCRKDDFYFMSNIVLYVQRLNMFLKIFDINKALPLSHRAQFSV